MGLNFQWSRFKLAVLSAIALGTHIAIATPVKAAETIIVRQGIMSLSGDRRFRNISQHRKSSPRTPRL
ncbi:MAG: hypothetical protein P5680_25455 [Limnospira sp. PMC 737.11]|uniref:Uncharacterized protein n=1 Tax=Limnospira fusiformis PMC 851.14 TaxID=2219512 RepID=A0ABU9EP76_LIMFS|nr:hypothetical protein [Limnospira sp. PMC 737.11]MDT9277855.1 hypothetical protein [Limnospira sp. PMC 737.11]